MKNLTFHIVGLTHNDVKGHEVEYAKEAEGRTICLVPDDANTFDMLAVKAYDKQQLIGYVSALEGEDVRALIIARKERNLRTRCIGCNSKNPRFSSFPVDNVIHSPVLISSLYQRTDHLLVFKRLHDEVGGTFLDACYGKLDVGIGECPGFYEGLYL